MRVYYTIDYFHPVIWLFKTVLLKLSDVADRQFFSMCQGPASEASQSLDIVSLFSGKYPRTSRRWYAYRHRYAYHTLSSTSSTPKAKNVVDEGGYASDISTASNLMLNLLGMLLNLQNILDDNNNNMYYDVILSS